jgi:Glycosyltransferase family 87
MNHTTHEKPPLHSPANNARKWNAPHYVKACAVVICAYLIAVHLWLWVLTYSLSIGGRADFRQLYAAGYMVRNGYRYQLYDYDLQTRFENLVVGPSDTPLPFDHLSYESLIFAPLSVFSYRTAYLIFLFINGVLVAASFRLLRPSMENLASIYLWLPAALFVAFPPIAIALIQGQDSIILLTLLASSFVLLQRKHDVGAGLLTGLTVFKFQIAIPIALLFLLWRRWRFVGGFAASATAALAVSTLLVGSAQMNFYAHWLLSMSVNATTADYLRNAITPNNMPNIRGLIFALTNHHITNLWMQASVAIASIILFVGTSMQRQFRRGSAALLITIIAASLLSYHLFTHDLAILFVPLVWVLNRYIVNEPHGPKGQKAITRSAVLTFCAPLAESFFPNHLYLVSLPILGFLIIFCREHRHTTPTNALGPIPARSN